MLHEIVFHTFDMLSYLFARSDSIVHHLFSQRVVIPHVKFDLVEGFSELHDLPVSLEVFFLKRFCTVSVAVDKREYCCCHRIFLVEVIWCSTSVAYKSASPSRTLEKSLPIRTFRSEMLPTVHDGQIYPDDHSWRTAT